MALYGKYRSLIRNTLAVIYLNFFFFRGLFNHKANLINFFTYWTLALELFYFTSTLIFRLKAVFLPDSSPSKQKIQIKRKLEFQLLSEIVLVSQICVVIFYWMIIYPRAKSEQPYFIINLQLHGGGLALIILDYAYNNIRGFSLRNHKYILGFGVLYTIFHSLIVLKKGPIYPEIDMHNLRSYLVIVAALGSLIFTHKIVYISVHWRHLKNELKSRKDVLNVLFVRSNSFNVSPLHFLWENLYNTDGKNFNSLAENTEKYSNLESSFTHSSSYIPTVNFVFEKAPKKVSHTTYTTHKLRRSNSF